MVVRDLERREMGTRWSNRVKWFLPWELVPSRFTMLCCWLRRNPSEWTRITPFLRFVFFVGLAIVPACL